MGKMSTRQVFAPAVKHQITVAASVTVFSDGGLYHGVDWENGVHVASNASLRTAVASVQTYLAGLGGGSVFLSLIGTHVFAPTLVVTVNGISFFGLGKSTVLQVNGAAPAWLIQVDADDVTFQNLAFHGNKAAYVSPGFIHGIGVMNDSVRTLIIGCYFHDFHNTNDHAIGVQTGSVATDVVVANCHFRDCDSYTVVFASATGHCIAIGCTVVDSGGFEIAIGSYNFAVGCSFRGYVAGSSNVIIYGLNFVIGCSFEGTNNFAIVGTVGVPVNNCAIIGCTFSLCIGQAILVGEYANDALISNNVITASVGAQIGVYAYSNVNRVTIIGNRINCVTGVCCRDATTVDTIMFDNNFNGCANPVIFGAAGPTIIVPTLVLPFIEGGNAAGIQVAQFIHADASPKGWEIDAANEWAITYGQLPRKVERILLIKVWAVGLAAPGANNQMLLDFLWYAGGSGESIGLNGEEYVNEESDQTNFGVNDVISWTFMGTWSIDQLRGGDNIGMKAKYNAASAPDIATDAVFRCVEIMYV